MRSCVAAVIAVFALSACRAPGELTSPHTPILLFTGTGTSPGDVRAIEELLSRERLEYATADSRRLNAANEATLGAHKLLIVPGGNFVRIGESLTSATATHIRNAINSGLNYLGICAGAFFAADSGYNSLNLANGMRFHFYSIESKGIRKAAVPISIPGMPTLEHYWEDGPQLTGWGDVIGRYPDGMPAIVEGAAGQGHIILTGVHPEAPESWRAGMTFQNSAEPDNDYAVTLIRAALKGTTLAHY